MTTLNSVTAAESHTTDRPTAGQMELALANALRRALSSDLDAPPPLDPAVLKPRKLLPRNMLLVGEALPLQKLAFGLLARWDIHAEVATSGADAVEIASAEAFDLIFIDAEKSVLDGVFVSSRLRHLERNRRDRATVPLVARISGDWPACENVLRIAGVNDVLTEATEGAAVGECLRRWCSGHYKPS
jgi:CheY-like chemotaxis protein